MMDCTCVFVECRGAGRVILLISWLAVEAIVAVISVHASVLEDYLEVGRRSTARVSQAHAHDNFLFVLYYHIGFLPYKLCGTGC